MAFDPKNITKSHVQAAIEQIVDKQILLKPSTRWLVEIEGNLYPPKEPMRYARKELDGSKAWRYGGGPPTNKFLEALGFNIIDKKGESTIKDTEMKKLSYREFEKTVFDWLMQKHKTDENFTFSVRQKGSKGAELDYFIGTEKSGYFGTTLWHIPVAYPGSSTDLINIMFEFSNGKPRYYWQFTQSKNADGEQNQNALQLIKNIAPNLQRIEGREFYQSQKDKKTFSVYLASPIRGYDNIKLLFENLQTDLKSIATNIDDEIANLKKDNLEFIAKRISLELFQKMLSKMDERFKRYATNENSTEVIEKLKPEKSPIPLNQILYGPPGTGKTYFLKNNYFERFTTRESDMSPEQYLNEVAKDLKWWEAIGLCLLENGKMKVAEILENRWVKVKISNSNSIKLNNTVRNCLQSHTTLENENVNVSKTHFPYIFEKDENSNFSINKKAVENDAPELLEKLNQVNNFTPNSDNIIKRYVFTTFHQSFAYEDFVEGIKPNLTDTESGELSYEIQDGIFKRISQLARNDLDNDYAIFIDEINRGNVSQIFGELITLIEEDKRAGKPNEISVKLPYSKDSELPFSVPPNLYIIGTMNTADRSVEALDSALRRRFSFKEMMPQPELLKALEWNGFAISEILETINQRIEILIDRDHTIGHSYFMGLEFKDDIQGALKTVFKDKVIPLLQEYFFNDYGKLQLILGNGFVESETQSNVRFATHNSSIETSDYDDKITYNIVKDVDLEKALTALMGQENDD